MDVKRGLAGSVVGLTGFGVAAPNALLFETSNVYALAASGVGITLGVLLVAAAVLLHRSDVSTPHALRVAGWNVLGVVALGLILALATQYPNVSLPAPVAASVIGVSAVAHVLIGVNDVRRIRVGELAREREKLAVLNRLARHNLRNQAQVLTSAGEIVGEHVSDGMGAEAAERVTDGARRIASINTKLKRFQEATEGRGETGPVDLAAAVDSVLEKYLAEYPDVEITADVPDGLAVSASPHLETALDELLENAFEHGAAGENGVTVRAATDGKWVDVTVADGGPGIPDQEWDIVSGDLEQSQLQHASGLGLWVVRGIVEGVGGELTRPADGGGVTMRFRRA